MDDPLPKPSIPVAAMAVLIVAVFVVGLAGSIATTVVDPNPAVILFAAFLWLPGGLTVSWTAWSAAFMKRTFSAQFCWALLFMTCILGLLFGTGIAAVAISEGASAWDVATILAACLVPAAAAAAGALVFHSRYKQLNAALAALDHPPAQRKVPLWHVGVAALAIVVLSGVFYAVMPPRFADHVDPSEVPFKLPAGASDVSYFRSDWLGRSYEFTLDEAGFRAWAAAEARREGDPTGATEIDEPVTVLRCYGRLNDADPRRDIVVCEGLIYRWSDDAGGFEMVWDRTTGRAYYNSWRD